jgi:hypothetical protein
LRARGFADDTLEAVRAPDGALLAASIAVMEGEPVSRLAIVIPSVGSIEALETTLLSVLENRPSRTEVIVVHAHPYSDPYQLQGEVQLIQASPRSSFVACANQGLRESTADVVHLLAAGAQVREGWTDGVLKHFGDPRVAVVAPLLLDLAEPTHAVAASLQYLTGGSRRSGTRFVADVHELGVTPILAASLAAAFYNRVTLQAVGMLGTDVGADLADVQLGLLLQRAGYRSLVDPKLHVRVPNGPLESVGAFRRGLYAERMFWQHASTVGWYRSLMAHPITVARDATGPHMLATLAGRAAGMVSFGSIRRRHQLLAQLRNSAPVHVEPEARTVRIDQMHAPQSARKSNISKAA